MVWTAQPLKVGHAVVVAMNDVVAVAAFVGAACAALCPLALSACALLDCRSQLRPVRGESLLAGRTLPPGHVRLTRTQGVVASVLARPHSGSPVVKVGAIPLCTPGHVFVELTDAAPEVPRESPSYLGRTAAIEPVSPQTLGIPISGVQIGHGAHLPAATVPAWQKLTWGAATAASVWAHR